MSLEQICIALGSACAVAWGVFTELRMQRLQRADEQLKRELGDAKITDSVKAESDADIKSELSAIVKG